MKEATFDSSVEDFAVTAEPHFDDERTVQSAQPVVPLEVINTRVRRRKQWFLGGAFAIAMMLGAASALVASYLKLRNLPPQTTAELSEVDVVAAPVAAAETEPEPLPEESPVESQTESAAVEETEEDPVPESPKREPVVRRRTVARAEPAEPRDGPRRDEDEELDRIRSAVLYDEWQERRARRAQRRERRRLERYNHRDLSNLDEIFEGRRKP